MVERQKPQQHSEKTSNLKLLRERLDMTQQEFASFLGIAASTVSRCERGLSEPEMTFERWKRLCNLVETRLKIPANLMPDRLSDFLTGVPESEVISPLTAVRQDVILQSSLGNSLLKQERSLSSVLQKAREALGLSREQFGVAIGVSGQTVYRWERGKSEPTFSASQMKRLVRLLEPLGLTLDDLPDEDSDVVQGAARL